MLPERTTAAPKRARARALRLPRLLWLATLLISLLLTHGLHGESAAGHLEAGITTSLTADEPASSADPDHSEHENGQHKDDESAGSAHNCAPSQPNGALDVPPPSTSPLEVTDPCRLLPRSGAHAVNAGPETTSPRAPSVLRI
ncbi:hypothetical protein [Streptomyces europaeiscabiei]|uniref:hypothetical protein n=1 Tax=Streptomyces europaeiscabiei TaxID=146819 RepID=UPI002E1448A8|nr:hypothetical protein OHB30_43235 [Streptomyces europaeiscabiei]